MSLIRLDKVSKFFSGEPVLDVVSFRVEEGEKIGLIGRNGSGKSTLFRLIMNETTPDTGTVERMRRAKVACLDQAPDVDPTDTLHELAMARFAHLIEMEASMAEMERRIADGDDAILAEYSALQDTFQLDGGYEFRAKARRVLTGLGFREEEFALPFSALSGGQRTRLMLALVLLENADLLLLDEPENHLDLAAREWLEGFLKEWPKAFVIISHDRRMLNAVVKRTVEVERAGLKSYTGNYDDFHKEKLLQQEQQGAAYDRQKAFIEREEAWIDRFRYKNTKARQVQSRVKRLEKLTKVDAPLADGTSAKFGLGEVVRSGQQVVEAKNLSMAYEGLDLYSGVSFLVERGERIGIIGPNGSGKTTLLKHLRGTLDGGTGEVTLGHKVAVGYYDQQHADLVEESDVFTETQRAAQKMRPVETRNFLGRFLFTGDDVFKPVSALSGGERSRVAMAKLVLENANLLLLDEPTNHLDIASREALEGALEEYPGSIVMVSHDRALIDRLVTKLIVIRDGLVEVFLGNYTDYLWRNETPSEEAETDSKDVMKIRKRAEADARKLSDKEQRKSEKQLKSLEERIHEIEELVEEREKCFEDIDPADFERISAASEEYEALKHDLKEMYSEWESLAELLSG